MNERNGHDRTTQSRRARIGILALIASGLLHAGCASERGGVSTNVDQTRLAKSPNAQVDCVLPGQIRQLGDVTYLTASRVVRTSASDCEIRGGTPEGQRAASASSD